MLTDTQIRAAVADGTFKIDPFDENFVQPASYDFRVGANAFASSTRAKTDVKARGVLVIEPGDFAVVETLERVGAGPQVAAQIGLRSEYARKGLLMLSGPQVDPGFEGILVVRVVNLATNSIGLPYGAPFLTAQLFQLDTPVERPYEGNRQGQDGLSPKDIEELVETEGLTLGGMLKTLRSLAQDVNELKSSVKTLSWSIPALVAFGITVIAILVAIK